MLKNTMIHALGAIAYPHLNPVIVHFGTLQVKWYGMAYLTAFVLAYWVLLVLVGRGVLRISTERLADLLGWLVAGVMLGGRIGWWLFYHRNTGASEAWYEPLAVWHGGMSFHGGLIGVTLALLVWSRLQRAPFWNLADCAALVTPIGLCLGRIANFINAELVGRPTTVPWGIIFPGDTISRHPSQLYEAILEGPILLLLLWVMFLRIRPREGRTALLFLIIYGVIRFAVEFTREPDDQLGFIAFGWLTMGQLLSGVISMLGVMSLAVPQPTPILRSSTSIRR
jgi:phosphatidylglycerol:prolipoprotein diacylglycerol transferase